MDPDAHAEARARAAPASDAPWAATGSVFALLNEPGQPAGTRGTQPAPSGKKRKKDKKEKKEKSHKVLPYPVVL